MTKNEKLEILEAVAEVRLCDECCKPFGAIKGKDKRFCSAYCRGKSHKRGDHAK